LIYLGISSCVLVLAGATAIAIPIFDYLTTLIGSLTMPLLTYMLPWEFYLRAKRHKHEKVSWITRGGIYVIWLFMILLTILGTIGTIMDIIDHWSETANNFC
jgi:hypothetical protein